jgi:hypothetical protein
MPIRQFRTTLATIRQDIQEALRLEGVPKRIRERAGFNGAMPGDGVALGSVTYPANAYGGQNALARIYNVNDIRDLLNTKESRERLARDARGYEAVRAKRAHPLSRAMGSDGLSAFDYGYSEDGEGVKLWRRRDHKRDRELDVFERPDDSPRYMLRLKELGTGRHINTACAYSLRDCLDKLRDYGVGA